MATNEEIIRAIGHIQGTLEATTKSVERLGSFVGEQVKTITQIGTDVAVVKNSQNEMKKSIDDYTEKCTIDRGEMTARLTSAEDYIVQQKSNTKWMSGVVSAIVSGVTTSAVVGVFVLFFGKRG